MLNNIICLGIQIPTLKLQVTCSKFKSPQVSCTKIVDIPVDVWEDCQKSGSILDQDPTTGHPSHSLSLVYMSCVYVCGNLKQLID